MVKRGTLWVEIRQFSKTVKEILLLRVIIMIIMNMQNKLYTVQYTVYDD